jgi:hypothetical protein
MKKEHKNKSVLWREEDGSALHVGEEEACSQNNEVSDKITTLGEAVQG